MEKETVNIPQIMKENRERLEAKNNMVKKNKKRYRLTQMSKFIILTIIIAAVQLFLINLNGINYILNILCYLLIIFVAIKIIFKNDL